jgi:hypothetical protein
MGLNIGGGTFGRIMATVNAAEARQKQNEAQAIDMMKAGFTLTPEAAARQAGQSSFSRMFMGPSTSPSDYAPGAHHSQVAETDRRMAEIRGRSEINSANNNAALERQRDQNSWQTTEYDKLRQFQKTEKDLDRTSQKGMNDDRLKTELWIAGQREATDRFTQQLKATQSEADRALKLRQWLYENQSNPLNVADFIKNYKAGQEFNDEVLDNVIDEVGIPILSSVLPDDWFIDKDSIFYDEEAYEMFRRSAIDLQGMSDWQQRGQDGTGMPKMTTATQDAEIGGWNSFVDTLDEVTGKLAEQVKEDIGISTGMNPSTGTARHEAARIHEAPPAAPQITGLPSPAGMGFTAQQIPMGGVSQPPPAPLGRSRRGPNVGESAYSRTFRSPRGPNAR